jgi:plasmid maintenance system killer protein
MLRKTTLVLAFASKSLREICEAEEQAARRFGKKVTGSLKHRLADLEAAPAALDLIAGRPQLQNPSGHYSVRLADGFCLEFAANHVKNPADKKGEVEMGSASPFLRRPLHFLGRNHRPQSQDWSKVTRIQIVRIGKCHD